MFQNQKPLFPFQKTLLENVLLQDERAKQVERRHGIQKTENPLPD